MMAGMLGLSILAILSSLVATFAGADTTGAFWVAVRFIPAIALPVALVLLVAFFAVRTVRLRRAATGGDR